MADAAKTISTYAKVRGAQADQMRRSGAAGLIVGGAFIGAGIVLKATGVGALLGLTAIGSGIATAVAGSGEMSKGNQIKTRSNAIDMLIAKSQGQSALTVARSAATGSRAEMMTPQHPAKAHTGAVAPPVSDGMVDPYTRIVNGKTVSVGGYKR